MRRSAKRMIGGAVQAICPPGFFCMDTGFIIFVVVVFLAIFVGLWTYKREQIQVVLSPAAVPAAAAAAPVQAQARDEPPRQSYSTQNLYSSTQPGIPTPPERLYDTQPDFAGMPPPGIPVVPIQVPTRGLPDQFQQMGVLTAPGGSSTSASPNRTLLPLYGRRTASGRERYNYYTRTDGYNPVQVPVSFKNRSCEDDNGCDEISSGDTVGVPLLGQTYVATTYKYNAPRYIPLI
jgi:hypothetical protein